MKMKASKIAYLVFVLILIAAICVGLIDVYKECKKYEENSESTMLQKSISQLENEIGFELSTNNVPSREKDGDSVYTVFHNGEEMASVRLRKNGTALGMLATFEIKEIKNLKRYTVVSPYLDKLHALNGELVYENEAAYDYDDAKALLSIQKHSVFPEMKRAVITSVYDFSQLEPDSGYELRQIKDDEYFLFRVGNENETKEVQAAADKFMNLYINYSTNNISFSAIQHTMDSKYPIYNKISKMKTTWLGSYTSLEILNKRISDAYMLSDDVALVDAEALLRIKRNRKNIDTDIDLSLVFIKEKGVWKAAEIANNFFFDHGEMHDLE